MALRGMPERATRGVGDVDGPTVSGLHPLQAFVVGSGRELLVLQQRDREVVRATLTRYASAYERGGLSLLERVIGAERAGGRYEIR